MKYYSYEAVKNAKNTWKNYGKIFEKDDLIILYDYDGFKTIIIKDVTSSLFADSHKSNHRFTVRKYNKMPDKYKRMVGKVA